jgi:heme/copper-type cytochrome/quinol oxidase subunit 2
MKIQRSDAASRSRSAAMVAGAGLHTQQAAFIAISVKGHRFQPGEIHAPANRPLTIKVTNLDSMPMEFESVSLRAKRVISPGGSGVVNVQAFCARPGSITPDTAAIAIESHISPKT